MVPLAQRNRVATALVLSIGFNCLLLIAAFITDTRDGTETVLSKIVSVLGLPAGAVAEVLGGGEHGGGGQVLVMLAASLVFYAAIAWSLLLLWVRIRSKHRRA